VTVPACVVPWAVHSQNPPSGMAVGQDSVSARQLFARAWPPPSAMAMISAAAKYPRDFMLVSLSWCGQGAY